MATDQSYRDLQIENEQQEAEIVRLKCAHSDVFTLLRELYEAGGAPITGTKRRPERPERSEL